MLTAAPSILSRLQEKLAISSGRHLYGIVGTYKKLWNFESKDLRHIKLKDGKKIPNTVNINKKILDRIDDSHLKDLVKKEGRMPLTIKKKLHGELDNLLVEELAENSVLILKQLELLYAYDVELDCLRRRATDEHHIILLLPGTIQNDRIVLFFEAGQENHRVFQNHLISSDHLWELK